MSTSITSSERLDLTAEAQGKKQEEFLRSKPLSSASPLSETSPDLSLATKSCMMRDSQRKAIGVLALALLRECEDQSYESSGNSVLNFNLAHEVQRFESNLIRAALIHTGGRQRRAARLLGMKKSTLNAKIKRYKIASDNNENLDEHIF